MKVIKKINNNIAVALDGQNHEVIVFSKGIGFGTLPYELKDMSVIERTFYDIDNKYYGLLKEIPSQIFALTVKMVDLAKTKIEGELNPNLVFVLADHIHFAILRDQKGLNVSLPFSFELEYEYPVITKIAQWMVKTIDEKFDCHLAKGEITSITMHFLNALEGTKKEPKNQQSENKINQVIITVTEIIEKFFDFHIDKKSFNYFRFKNHLKYFVQRKENHDMFPNTSQELFENMIKEYPETYRCVCLIDNYLCQKFIDRCSDEELLYLIIHVNRLYMKEDCNRKGITPDKKT